MVGPGAQQVECVPGGEGDSEGRLPRALLRTAPVCPLPPSLPENGGEAVRCSECSVGAKHRWAGYQAGAVLARRLIRLQDRKGQVTQGQLPALGGCPPPGISRAARGVGTGTGHSRWDSPALPWPQPTAAWGPETARLLPTSPGVPRLGSGLSDPTQGLTFVPC